MVNAISKEEIGQLPLVALQGSEKQIQWASDIREEAIIWVWPDAEDEDEQKALVAAINRHPEAKFWIDNRTKGEGHHQNYFHLLQDDWNEELDNLE